MSDGFIIRRGGSGGVDAFKVFVDRSITNVTEDMLDGLTSIPSSAFYSCTSLKSIEIPNSVTSIDSEAFYNCDSLTSIEIPNSVTSIGYNAFFSCSSLASITIPNSVTSIGNSAFQYCTSLASVTVEATNPPTLGNTVFNNTHANLVIYVPAESVDTYKAASGWSTYADKIQAIPSN